MYKKRIDVPTALRAFIERQQRALLELRSLLASVAEGDRRNESPIKEEGAA